MAAVQITSANSNSMNGTNRCIFRSSSGTLYAAIWDSTNAGWEVWKSSDGTSWVEQDTANRPANANYFSGAATIDGANIIHLQYRSNISMATGMRYIKFHTVDASSNQDTWQGDELAISGSVLGSGLGKGIACDSSNIPHVVYTQPVSNMGTDYNTILYSNRIGGTWKAGVQVEGATNSKNCDNTDLTISDENIPEVAYYNSTDAAVSAAQGNLNNATSFTLFDVETSGKSMDPSIAIDSTGATVVAYINSTDDLLYRKCPDGATWTSGWDAAVNIDSTNNLKNPSVSIDGTDIYIFAVDTGNSDVYYYKNAVARVSLEAGTFDYVRAKWTSTGNTQSSTQIDYLFSDTTASPDVWWNKLVLSAPAPPIPVLSVKVYQSINRSNTY